MKHHVILIRMATIKKMKKKKERKKISVDKDEDKLDLLCTVDGNVK